MQIPSFKNRCTGVHSAAGLATTVLVCAVNLFAGAESWAANNRGFRGGTKVKADALTIQDRSVPVEAENSEPGFDVPSDSSHFSKVSGGTLQISGEHLSTGRSHGSVTVFWGTHSPDSAVLWLTGLGGTLSVRNGAFLDGGDRTRGNNLLLDPMLDRRESALASLSTPTMNADLIPLGDFWLPGTGSLTLAGGSFTSGSIEYPTFPRFLSYPTVHTGTANQPFANGTYVLDSAEAKLFGATILVLDIPADGVTADLVSLEATSVPEPTTGVLLASGLGSFLFARRRRSA